MNPLLQQSLDHLVELVGFDTRNPPRNISSDGIVAYLAASLPGFECEITDLGNGSVNLLATRGRPDTLFNFHIDTVPASPQWTRDPFKLSISDDRASGLGACDIKGAAACMLAAAAETSGDVALLFSSDEEAGNSTCIPHFLGGHREFSQVVVAEPTLAKAVLAHRGIASGRLAFRGTPGHASLSNEKTHSAVHRAIRWANRALDTAAGHDKEHYETLRGLRFNVGRIEGGIKPNMIAGDAEVRFGLRGLPGRDSAKLLTGLAQLAEPDEVSAFDVTFAAPSLPANANQHEDAMKLARDLGLELGDPVDFWTEAALFSAHGMPAIVYGPGDIAQAHTANEWVSLAQLDQVAQSYMRILA